MKIYTIAEIVELTGLSDKTIRRHIKSGELPATKEPGPRGLEYRIAKESLEKWLEGRNVKTKDGVHGVDGSKHSGLVPYERIQELQAQLSNAIYRAGQAEGQLRQLEEEMNRLLEERARYEARIRELEEQKQELLERNEQLQQQFYNDMKEHQTQILKKLEERDKLFCEFITAWREEQEKRQQCRKWWRFWEKK